MQPSEKDLSKYRLERAREDIQTAKINGLQDMTLAEINAEIAAVRTGK